VYLTHHHGDHVEGLPGIQAHHNVKTIGASADAHRLPKLDLAVSEGDEIEICGQKAQIFDVSGHTIGHIAIYIPSAKAVFTADSLMALGCGRVFEGTMEQMWTSLSKIAALPPETTVYSGHEYTATNAKFALTIEPDNADLQARYVNLSASSTQMTPKFSPKFEHEKTIFKSCLKRHQKRAEGVTDN